MNASTKYFCVVVVVLGLTGTVAYGQDAAKPAAAAQPAVHDVPPPDCDFEPLGLQVVSVEAVPSIRSGNTEWSPKDGRKLVVVRLQGKGKVPASFTQASNWSDIQAVYGVPMDQSGGIGFAIEPASAFVVLELMGGAKVWTFSKASQGGGVIQQVSAINNRPVISSDGSLIRIPNRQLTVAFALPAFVKTITLRIPVAAKNAAGSAVHEIK